MGYALKSVNSIESMLRYCNDSLKWNIDEEYFDDIDELTYDFSASDLGIKDEEFAKINVLKQMRPLTDNQDWAVFFVEFEGKHIDVTALRKVLNAIVPIERATYLIAHLEEQDIDVQELDNVLKEIFEHDINVLQNSKPAIRTNVRRLIMIYDLLKWG